MARLIIYSSLVALPLALAMPWEGPKPTPAGQRHQELGWTPKPTPEPVAFFQAWELRKRQAAASTSTFSHGTCGFLLGAADNPLTCINSGYSCALDSQHSVFGCCSSLAECTLETTCIPQSALSGCNAACAANPYILQCDATYPYCNERIVIPATGTVTATNWYCDDTITIVTEFAAATDSNKPTATYVPLTQNIPSSSSTTSSSSSPSATSSVQPQSTSTIPYVPPTPTTSPTPTSSPSPTPIGAIVGGVIGGLVVVAAIILGIIFYLRRNKTPPPAPAPVVAATASGPAPGPNPNVAPVGPYYNQPIIAEKDGGAVPTQQGGRAEMYSPPQSPAPQYTSYPTQPVQNPGIPPNQYQYPNMSEMDAGQISPHAAPGSY